MFVRRATFATVFAIVLTLLGAGRGSDAAVRTMPPLPEFGRSFVPGEVIIKYKDTARTGLQTGVGRALAAGRRRIYGLSMHDEISRGRSTELSRITDGRSVAEKVRLLNADPDIEYAEPNFYLELATISTNDPSRGLLWGLDNTGQTVNGTAGTADADIDAPEAWAVNEGTNDEVIVAVIDTGAAYNHPDLLANMWDGSSCVDGDGDPIVGGCNYGWDFQDDDNSPLISSNVHGSHVAGTIGAVKNNAKGIIGVAPNVKIMALKFGLTTSQEVEAIDFAIANGAKVINASYGGGGANAVVSQAEYDAIERFQESGGLFVAAAGNFAWNIEVNKFYPAGLDLPGIISVAATTSSDGLASFSNYGVTSVDVGAPGVSIYSTVPGLYLLDTKDLEDAVVPGFPAGWTGTGDWGTEDMSGDIVAWGDDDNIPYAPNASTTLTSPTFDMSEYGGLVMTVRSWCDTEYNLSSWLDYMELQVSGDGSTWYTAAMWDEVWLDGLNGGPFNSSGGAEATVSSNYIPSYAVTNAFRYRFRWITTASDSPVENYLGCWVDDAKIYGYTDGNDEQYSFLSGTSMASPHVAGLAALIWGYNPNLTAAEVKDIILTTGEVNAALDGKSVSEKRVNAHSALLAAGAHDDVRTFDFLDVFPDAIGVIDHDAGTIDVEIVTDNDLSALTPTITISGLDISPASGVEQDFTNPVVYTVTAPNGTTHDYTVTVTLNIDPDYEDVAADKNDLDANDILGANPDLDTVTVALTDPLPSSGANGSVITWASSATSIVSNDGQTVNRPSFSSGDAAVTMTATITKGAASDTKEFELTVIKAPVSTVATVSSSTYTVGTAGGANRTISDIPYGTAKSTFLAGLSMDQVDQAWNSSDISDPVVDNDTLVVTAEDDLTQITYTMAVDPNDDTTMVSFVLAALDPDVVAAMDHDQHIGVVIPPFGTSPLNVVPTITLADEATVSPTSGTPVNFNLGAVTYSVTAGDGTQQNYFITFHAQPATPTITSVATDDLIGDAEKAAIVVQGTAPANSKVMLTVSDGTNSIEDEQQLSGGGTAFSIEVDGTAASPAALEDGPITVTVVARDSFNADSDEDVVVASQHTEEPDVTTLGDGSSDAEFETGDTEIEFSVTLSSSSKTAVETAISIEDDAGDLSYAWSGATLTVTAANDTIIDNDVEAAVTDIYGNASSSALLIIDSALESDEVAPNGSGAVTVSNGTPRAVITDPDLSITLTVPSGVTSPEIDLGSLISGGTGTVPAISITATNVDGMTVAIPAGTTVTSDDASWDGILPLPTSTSVTIPVSSNQTADVAIAISLGTDDEISFDKGVRLLFPDQSGKRVGFIRPSTSFTEITETCAADNQTVGDALVAGDACSIDVSDDLVVWTTHFTDFAAYSISTSSGGGGGGGGGGGAAPAITETTTTTPIVTTTGLIGDALTGEALASLTVSERASPVTDPTVAGTWSSSVATASTPTIDVDKSLFTPATGARCIGGTLIKGVSSPAVYYCGRDGRRYVFPNERIFRSWYKDFSSVVVISDADLASIRIAGNVTYRPGVRMLKIQSDPKVYAVSRKGTLRWVPTEAIARALYGTGWNSFIDDVSDAFFFSYAIGEPITAPTN